MDNIIKIKKDNNNYLINNKDIIIVNKLIKSKIVNKRNINKLIKKLDFYHIDYLIDNQKVVFNDNKYAYYYDKFSKELKLREDIYDICKYLEDNILRKDMKKILKEIEIIINE